MATSIRSGASPAAIKLAALQAFAKRGYHGTTVREIAKGAGISVPGIYHHFTSKQEILVELVNETMADLLTHTEEAVRAAPTTAAARLKAAVGAHVTFHTLRRPESFVGNTELRSLDGEARNQIVAQRDRQQNAFDEIVLSGVSTGEFVTEYPKEASRAIVTMCTAVATWYHPDGPLEPADVVTRYQSFAMSLVGCGVRPT